MIPTSSTAFYVAQQQVQKGPFPLSEIKQMLKNGEVAPTDLCWAEGMGEWQPLKDIVPIRTSLDEEEGRNPYTPPETPPNDIWNRPSYARSPEAKSYGGIGRMKYFALTLAIGFAQNTLISGDGKESSLIFAVFGASLLASFYVVAQRLINVGMKPWMCVLSIVPIVNFFIGYRCLVCPEGYEDNKKLDKAGKILVWVYAFLVLMVISAMVILMTAPQP